jgi:phage tail tape-measure protein
VPKGSSISRVGRLGKLARPLAVVGTGLDFIGRKASGQSNVQAGVGAAGGLAGAIGGAKIGAAIGTAILPGVGTVIGGILGSFIGASAGGSLSDSITGANADKKRKEEIKKLATPQASLFSGSLDTFDVVLEKFAKLRASEFDHLLSSIYQNHLL